MTIIPTPVIAVDGPSGAGKGTVGRALADELGWHFLDSGALYRLTTLAALQNSTDLAAETAVAAIAEQLDVCFRASDGAPQVLLAGRDVTAAIREEGIGRQASVIAAHAQVREALLYRQRAFAVSPGLVADGRDMGTVVFKDAPLKVFLTASAAERAKRRLLQLERAGTEAVYTTILADIEARDHRDRQRASAPLLAAADAITITTDQRSAADVVAEVLQLAQARGLC